MSSPIKLVNAEEGVLRPTFCGDVTGGRVAGAGDTKRGGIEAPGSSETSSVAKSSSSWGDASLPDRALRLFRRVTRLRTRLALDSRSS